MTATDPSRFVDRHGLRKDVLTDDESIALEQRIRDAAVTGALVDLTDAEDQDVPAQLLVDLLIRPLKAGEIRRAVRLAGATIVGELDLAATTLVCPLVLSDCELSSPAMLYNADAPAVTLTRCTRWTQRSCTRAETSFWRRAARVVRSGCSGRTSPAS